MGTEPYEPRENAQRSGYELPGFAERYAAGRPSPPAAVVDLLVQLAGAGRPGLVADLGSGTGLSTRMWAPHAAQVIGVEPLDAMRRAAEAAGTPPNLRFQAGVAQQTGLPDGAADIVTCAQALHWMDPGPTLAEVARILRPGGVFAAYDYDGTPAVEWTSEQTYERCIARRNARWQRGEAASSRQWPKAEHLARMRESGHFRYVREVVLHHIERWSAERWVAYALSSMPGISEGSAEAEEIGIGALRRAAWQAIGDREVPAIFGYRVRIGVR
jgi:SAM-dependent methyltransferase